MKVKRVSKNVIDVFHGQGWDNWCRFQIDGGKLKMIAGTPVPSDVLNHLYSNMRGKK